MNELDFLDIISILSFIVGIKNLDLNEQQVHGLSKHLDKQDVILVEQQNKMLKTIIKQNEEIISILKGETNAQNVTK